MGNEVDKAHAETLANPATVTSQIFETKNGVRKAQMLALAFAIGGKTSNDRLRQWRDNYAKHYPKHHHGVELPLKVVIKTLALGKEIRFWGNGEYSQAMRPHDENE